MPPKIKTAKPWVRADANTVVTRGRAVVSGMGTGMGPTAYPTPPVSLDFLKNAVDRLDVLATESLDGSRKVIAEKKKQKEAVVRMLEQNAQYVENNCKDDMPTFLISGFEPKPNTKNPPQDLPAASVEELKQGASGVFEVTPKSLGRTVLHYEVRVGELGAGGAAPASWSEKPITKRERKGFKISGLKPGTTYAIQVRALGPLGYTEWTDSITKMAT